MDTIAKELVVTQDELQEKNNQLKKLERAHRKDLESREKKYNELNKQYHNVCVRNTTLENKLVEEADAKKLVTKNYGLLKEKLEQTDQKLKKLEQDLYYYRLLAQKRHILLVNMRLRENAGLPYDFLEVTLEQLQKGKLPKDDINEAWLVRADYNLFAYNQLLTRLTNAYGEINVTDIDGELAEELKIEVLK